MGKCEVSFQDLRAVLPARVETDDEEVDDDRIDEDDLENEELNDWCADEDSNLDEEELAFEGLPGARSSKIQKTHERARNDDIQWIWVDTCGIDKESSAELSEAINSMYS
jgi:hypothetical protein